MRKFKKILAVSLAAALSLSMVACGSSTTTDTTSTDDTAVADDTASDDTTDDAASDNTASDASSSDTPYNEGETRTIKIGTWYDHYYDSTHTDIYDDPSVSDEELAQMHFDNVARVEEKYNVKIEFVNLTWDGIQESINTSILAGKPDCDIYEVGSFGFSAVCAGYATNLAEVLPADADVLTDQIILNQISVGQDGVYLFAQNSAEAALYNTYMVAFNKQMLDDAGLEDPNVLFENGEWTWDKWREYLQTLTKDSDGDGVIDVYGYGSRYDFLMDGLMMSNGTGIATSATEGVSSAEVGECLDFINTIYNVDNTAKPWNVDDFDANMNSYTDGSVACWIDAAWISSSNADSSLGFDIIWCPFPTGPSGDVETNYRRNLAGQNSFMIPTGVEDPELVYSVFEDWANWYQDDTSVRDSDLTWWEDCAMTEENYAVMEWSGEKSETDFWNSLNVDYSWPSFLAGEMTPAQFQETNKQLVQAALDDMMN